MKIWVKILRLYYDIFAKIAPTLRKLEKKIKNLGDVHGGRGRAAAPPRPPQAHGLVLQGTAPRPYEAHVLVLLSVFPFSRFSQYWRKWQETIFIFSPKFSFKINLFFSDIFHFMFLF